MRHPLLFRRSLWLALLVTIPACGEDESSGLPLVPVPRPIAEGLWHMHAADSTLLPARVSDRFVGVTLEETFLDSAQLSVDYVTGRYVQRLWTRVNHTGIEDRREFIFDEGDFAQTGDHFTFTSTARVRTFTVVVPDATELTSTEAIVFWSGAPTISGTYRQTRP